MEHVDQRPLGTEPPGDRLSRLSRASLRINESLDVDNALQAVMDSARSLTDAPYAAIITLDASGAVEDHLVLGFDPGDVERLWQAPQGQVFFEYLNALPGPLRVGRLEEFTASIGLGEFRSPVQLTAFMAAPILRQEPQTSTPTGGPAAITGGNHPAAASEAARTRPPIGSNPQFAAHPPVSRRRPRTPRPRSSVERASVS